MEGEARGQKREDGSPLVRRTVSSPTSSMCTTLARSRVKCQGMKPVATGGHTRGHQPTAHHHQAAKAILSVAPPPVGALGRDADWR